MAKSTPKSNITPDMSLSSAVATLLTSSKDVDDKWSITVSDKYGIITAANMVTGITVRIIMPSFIVNQRSKCLRLNKLYIRVGTTVLSIVNELGAQSPATLVATLAALTYVLDNFGKLYTLHSADTQLGSVLSPSDVSLIIQYLSTTKIPKEVCMTDFLNSLSRYTGTLFPYLYGKHISIPFYPNSRALASSAYIYLFGCISQQAAFFTSLVALKE